MHEYATTMLQPVCPDCGLRLSVVSRADFDWRDDRERVLGENAQTVQEHRAAAHPVRPKLGDVVVYHEAWRGLILGTGPLVVRGIHEHDLNEYARGMGQEHLAVEMGTRYHLVSPARESDYYLPSTGDIRRPITFEILDEYVALPVEQTLFDLLGDEWADAEVGGSDV